MIIDFHTHIFPDKIAEKTISFLAGKGGITPYGDGRADTLKASMERAGIALSVTQPVVTRPEQFESIFRFTEQINEAGGALYSFGGIHPASEHYKEELTRIAEAGFRGIKLHPDYQDMFADDIRMIRVTDYALEKGLLVLFHAGFDVGYPDEVHASPRRMDVLLKAVGGGQNRIILAHLGGLKEQEEVQEYLVGRDIYMDVAATKLYLSGEDVLRTIRAHGADKILFGSDNPWGEQKEYVDWIGSLPLEPEEKAAIFADNARKLLNID